MDPALVCLYNCWQGLKNAASWVKNGPTHQALSRDYTDSRVDIAGTEWSLFWWMAAQKLIMAIIAGVVFLVTISICSRFGVYAVPVGF